MSRCSILCFFNFKCNRFSTAHRYYARAIAVYLNSIASSAFCNFSFDVVNTFPARSTVIIAPVSFRQSAAIIVVRPTIHPFIPALETRYAEKCGIPSRWYFAFAIFRAN